MDKPPSDTQPQDIAHQVGKAITSAVPLAGGPLSVLFETIFTPSLERRKQAWLENLASVIEELKEQVDGVTEEKLSKDEQFITMSIQASQIAMRTHKQEKIEALRAAILHSALPGAPEEDQQAIFLNLIDELTPWHLNLLALLDNPAQWMEKHDVRQPNWDMGGVSRVIEHCFPRLRGDAGREFYDQLFRDLKAAGLVAQGDYLHTTMTGQGMVASRTTGLGEAFISFITNPE